MKSRREGWREITYVQQDSLRSGIYPSGGARRIGWNAQGLPDALTDGLGRTTRYSYDVMGHITAVAEAASMLRLPAQNTETRFSGWKPSVP